jgi:hypothetical protein
VQARTAKRIEKETFINCLRRGANLTGDHTIGNGPAPAIGQPHRTTVEVRRQRHVYLIRKVLSH